MKSETKFEYKIRRTTDGLYSKGGSGGWKEVDWSKTGKTWGRIGDVKSHLHQHLGQRTYGGISWDQVEVVEVKVEVTENGVYSAKMMLELLKEAKKVKAQKSKARWKAVEKARLERELEKLERQGSGEDTIY